MLPRTECPAEPPGAVGPCIGFDITYGYQVGGLAPLSTLVMGFAKDVSSLEASTYVR